MENENKKQSEQGEKEKHFCRKMVHYFEKIKGERSMWESHWQECMDYVVPRKASMTTKRTPGEKRGSDLFDSTAISANQLLGGALHGMLTNPSVKFFDLYPSDPKLLNNESVTRWMSDCSDAMFSVMNQSNFQTEVHELYLDLGAIGTACMFVGEDKEKVVHFGTRSMSEIYVAENNLGIIDTVIREFQWTPKQIIDEFGEENVPKYIYELHERHIDDKINIIHCVMPQDDDEKKGTFAFKSVYILVEKQLLLSEGGFKEFPYAVPRWTKTSGEVYGRGPAMEVLPDIKMVNAMMQVTISGAQRTINPPLMVNDDAVIGQVRLIPGGLTLVRPSNQEPIRPLITDARIDFGYQVVEDVRKRIRTGFYVDQLQLGDGPQMTATEVMQRTEEKLRLMGPVLGRQHFEFLRPVIERVFAIMYRRGMLPAIPKEMQGKYFDVKYSSLVAKAQRLGEGQNLARAMQLLAPFFQIAPQSMDLVDTDAAVKYVFSDIYGAPSKVIRDGRSVQALRKDRADQQAQMQQQAQEAQQAQNMGQVLPAAASMVQAEKA